MKICDTCQIIHHEKSCPLCAEKEKLMRLIKGLELLLARGR